MKIAALLIALIPAFALAQGPKEKPQANDEKKVVDKKDEKKKEDVKDETKTKELTPEEIEQNRLATKKMWNEIRNASLGTLIFFLVVYAFIVNIPVMIAYWRRHPNRLSIALMMIFLGWVCCFIIWPIALIWACSAIDTSKRYR